MSLADDIKAAKRRALGTAAVDAIAFGACAVRVHPGPPWFEAVRPRGARGLQSVHTWIDDAPFTGTPTRVAILCGEKHPDLFREASCSKPIGHVSAGDEWHETDDKRLRWTIDLSVRTLGGIWRITVEPSSGVIVFANPPATAPVVAAPSNRKARRAARKIKR